MKISPIEKKISANLVSLRDKPVGQILIPRSEIVALPHDLSLSEMMDAYAQSRYTRYPVFYRTLDWIVGVIHVYDVVPFWHEHVRSPVIEYSRLPCFVYEHRSIFETLMEFQASHLSLGIVIDEFGAVTGMVTMDILIGAIIGDYRDESTAGRDRPALIEKKSDRESIVYGRIHLDEFAREFGLAIHEHDVTTLAGLVVKQADGIPKAGDEIVYKNLKFTVLAATRRTVTKVKVEKL